MYLLFIDAFMRLLKPPHQIISITTPNKAEILLYTADYAYFSLDDA